VCSCRKNKAATGTTYTVTYPGGGTTDVTTLMAAKLAAGKVPGATYTAKPKTT
jgi:hypothetical protein